MPSLLSLALLCLSLHVCHGGRQIGVSSRNFDDIKVLKDVAKKVEVDQPLIGTGGKNKGAIEAIPRKIGENQEAIQGAVDIVSLVKVSWKMPNRKDGAHTGFNLDYYQPRTHPPSHN